MSEISTAELGAQFLSDIFENLGVGSEISVHEDGQMVRFRVDGDAERIGQKTELVSALSLLTSRVLSRQGVRCDCVLDFGGRYEARADFLSKVADELGEIAGRSNQRILISDLSSSERKIMHHALAETEGVSTRSDGRNIRRFIIEPSEDTAP